MITSNNAIKRHATHPDPDTMLMMQVRMGDDKAFEQLMLKYRGRVNHWLGRAIDDKEKEDLFQDIFLRVYRARLSYEPRSRFSTWLYAIVRNMAANRRMSVRYQFEKSFLYWDIDVPGNREKTSLPNSSVELVELEDTLADAIKRLSPRQREALWMFHYCGEPYGKIAKELGTSTDAVKSLLHRARCKLKGILLQKHGDVKMREYLEC